MDGSRPFLLCDTFASNNDSYLVTFPIKERFLVSLFRSLHGKVALLTKERHRKPKGTLPTGVNWFRFRTQHWTGGGREGLVTSYIRSTLGELRVVPFVVLVEIFYPTPIGGIGAINGLREVQGAFL